MKPQLFLGLLCVVVAVAASPALAGKGGGSGGAGGGSSITLVTMGGSGAAATASPSFGQQVTFAVSTNKTDAPWVWLHCYQGSVLVYSESHAMFASSGDSGVFSLGPSFGWTGGAASCTALLVEPLRQGNSQVLATTSFDVSA